MTETRLFLAPCSRKYKPEAYAQFKRRVEGRVSPHVHEELAEQGYSDPIGIWGVVSGNEATWEQLQAGDIVLFYTKSGVYTHLAEVVDTQYNEQFATKIWSTYDGHRLVNNLDEPWPFLIHLTNVQPVNLPAQKVHEALGYSMEYPLGFMKPSDEAHQTLIEKYGGVRDFIGQTTTAEVSATAPSIQMATEQLQSSLNSKPTLTEDPTYTETERLVRSTAFRREIRELYDRTCCVCGAQRESPSGAPEIEAAHIYPKGEGGKDDIRNGVALCRLHHWALDVGWISISNNHRILTKDTSNRRGYEEFSRLSGQSIRVPDREPYRPHPTFLGAHREFHNFENA